MLGIDLGRSREFFRSKMPSRVAFMRMLWRSGRLNHSFGLSTFTAYILAFLTLVIGLIGSVVSQDLRCSQPWLGLSQVIETPTAAQFAKACPSGQVSVWTNDGLLSFWGILIFFSMLFFVRERAVAYKAE